MGICLNPGNDDFKRAINSKIYVDKSMLLAYTNSVLKTEQRFVFVSRPVKFGKTMAANMLTAYYSKVCDSRELFSNLRISKDVSFEKHLNKYNVIRLNMARFISGEQNVDNVIDKINQKVIKELKKAFPDVDYYDDTKLVRSLKDIFSEKLISFVFIIDEWDSVIVKFKDDKESQKRYVDYLTYLLKDKSYVALAYMTGILPIKKFGTHSGLDMFYEYTMTNQRKLAEFTGFTENEVAELCDKYNMPFDEFKRWYGSYIIDGISIYNPRSVVEAIIDNSFNNYWVQTMNYYVLRDYISSDYDELREKIVKMIEGESVKVTTRTFQNDMTTFKSADDVLTLFVHLGYLTFDFDSETISIPNHEVMEQFVSTTRNLGWSEVVK